MIEKLLETKLSLINNIHALLSLNLILFEKFIKDLMKFFLVKK